MNLLDVSSGETASVADVTKPDLGTRLESLGIHAGGTLRIIRTGEPLIVQAYGSRIGLARSVADSIRVTLTT